MENHVDLEILERYLDGELRPGARRRVRAHLEGCPECRRQLERLDQQGALLRGLLEEKAAAEDFSALHQRVMQQIRRQPALPWRERLRAWLQNAFFERRAAFALAAAAAMLLLVAGWFWLGPRPGPAGVREASTAAALAAGAEQSPAIIDSLEYSGQRSLIYTVSRNNTTVIWLVDFDQAARAETQGEDL